VTFQTCDLSPFVAKVVAQKGSLEDAASALQIFIRQLEGYLRQLKAAICTDLGNAGGVKNFIDLLDVPNTYFGSANKLVRVNSLADGLEFFTSPYATAFLDLIDVPHSYAGASLKGVRVNVGETGLEFYLRSLIGLSDFPASYTSQALKFLRVNAAATAVEFVVAALTLLSDFPASYSGAALKALRVNAGATAVEFFTQALTLLSDFPANYSGAALKRLRVNGAATAVEFITDSFINLSDCPASYSGAANKVVGVNAAANGLVFFDTTISDLGAVITPFTRALWLPSTDITTAFLGAKPTFAGAGAVRGMDGGVALATTNLLTSSVGFIITAASTAAGQAASIRSNPMVWRGNASGLGGFKVKARFATERAIAQQRSFIGLTATDALLSNANPSTFLNLCGFSYDSAATNWSTITNDGSGTATTSSLGVGYPVDATTVFEMTLVAQPNGSAIDWTIANLTSGASTSGSFSSDLPSNTSFLCFQFWSNNGTSSGAGNDPKATFMHIIVAQFG
jgi:hypothetical protein